MGLKRLWLVVACVGLTACAAKPPPPPPEPEIPDIPPPPPPKKKPPPKCESFEEKCVAKESSKAKIASTQLAYSPVPGWSYAQTEAATVAQADEAGPVLTLAGVDLGEAKKEAATRDAILVEMAKGIGLTLPKKKLNWKKPDGKPEEKGEFDFSIWQIEGVKRGDKKGVAIVVSGATEKGHALVGIGFVPKDDDAKADVAILHALSTIAARPQEGDGEEKKDKKGAADKDEGKQEQ